MKTLILTNGKVLDPSWNMPKAADVLLESGLIKQIGENLNANDAQTIDCSGKIIIPGFIDLHSHIFESLQDVEHALDLGTRSAVKGGFTTICAMSDTNPPLDNEGMIGIIRLLSKNLGRVNVIPSACATQRLRGEAMSEISGLINAGAGLICDPGNSIKDTMLLRRLMEYTKMFSAPLFLCCEDEGLSKDALINEGEISTRLGLVGNPSVSEDIIVARDILLAEYLKSKIHISHVSTEGSVNIIRDAKKRGVMVTCSTTPHHIDLTQDDIKDFNAIYKVTPPLRTEKDRSALVEGLRDGTIDAISTDHSPCSGTSKKLEFARAPFGMIGMETAFQVCFKRLVIENNFSISLMLDKLVTGPAKILGIDTGKIEEGQPADLCIIDLERDVEITKDYLVSKSKNTPYLGKSFKGEINASIVGGVVRYLDRKFY